MHHAVMHFSSRHTLHQCALRSTSGIQQKRNTMMSPFILLFLVLAIFVCAFGYMTYRHEAERRAREKRRNQYHDRI